MSDISHKQILELNGENYNPLDNSTFKDEPLSLHPHEDIFFRMALADIDKKGGNGGIVETTRRGAFFAHYTTSRETANDKVLQFPKAAELPSMILVKKINLTTILPASLMERYKLKTSVSHTQKTPVFYSKKMEKFVMVCDRRILVDSTKQILQTKQYKNISTLRDKHHTNFLYVFADTLDELRENLQSDDSEWATLVRRYRTHFLSMLEGERVIVLKYACDIEDGMKDRNIARMFSLMNAQDSTAIKNLMFATSANMVYFQAVKIDSYFYLNKEDGTIDPMAAVHFDHRETDLSDTESFICRSDESAYLVMPYTDDSWAMIRDIHEKMSALFESLNNLMLSTKTSNTKALDKPITEAVYSENLLPILKGF